jgi:hypothetical protein
VPATGVSSVAVNIHVTNPTVAGALPAWPAGSPRPGVSTLLFSAGTGTTSTPSVVKLNSAGEASFQNLSSGTLRLMVDVAGYYTDSTVTTTGSRFVPLPQSRIVDTRNAVGVPTRTPIPANGVLTTAVAGKGGLPGVAAITAVAVNVTVLSPTALGRWTLFPTGTAVSSANNSFYFANRAKTAGGIARLAANGQLSLYSASTGTAHFMIEVVGYYTPSVGTDAAHVRVQAVTPTRILDTGATLVPAGGTTTVQVAGKPGVPATGVRMAAIHVIGLGSGTGGQLVTYPPGSSAPVAADVIFPASQYSYNLLWARLDSTGAAVISNGTGAGIHIWVDIQAYALEPAAPGRPTGVVSTPLNGAAAVSWTAPEESGDLPIRDYEVTASPGGQTAISTGTNTTVTGLANDAAYTFTVRARNAAAGSLMSAASDPVTPTAPKVPGKPFITDLTPRDSELLVSWVAPPTGPKSVESYRVVVNPGNVTVSVPGTSTDAVVSGLVNGTTYIATVYAVNGAGEQASDPSAPAVPEVADVPLAPILSSVTTLSGRVDLQWLPSSDGGSNVTAYEIDVSPGGQQLTTPADTTVLSVAGLTNDVEYTFQIRARNKIGVSDARTAKGTPVAARVPAAPAALQASSVANGSVLLKWEAPADTGTSALTGYTVEISPGGRQVPTATTTATVTDLDPATQYTFTVRALNSAGSSAPSEATEPVTPAVTLAATPVVLTAESMARLRYAHDDGTLTFENANTQLRAIKVGDFVVTPASAKTPRGLLRRVSTVEDQGALLSVSTAEANLSDIFDDGALASRLVVNDDDLAGFVPAGPQIKLREAMIDGKTLREGAAKAGTKALQGAPSIGLRDGAFVLEFSISSQGKSVSVSMSLKPEVKAQFDIGLGTANTATEITNQVVVESKASVTAPAIKFERELDLGTIKPKCFTVTVGPVPVLICPELKFTYGVTAEGKLGATLKVSYGREIGSRIETKGEQVSATSINRAIGTNGTAIALSAALKLKTGPAAKLTVYLMGISGPSVRVEIFTELSADTFADPWWKISLGINLGAGWSGKLFKWKFEWSEDELLSFSTDLAAADGPFKGLLIDDHPAQIQLGTSQTFHASVQGYPDAPATWRLVSGAGSITPEGVFQASDTQMGDVVVEATVPGGVGRPVLAKRTQIRVGPGLPAAPTGVTAKSTPLGADVTWTAPFDGGSTISHYVVRTTPDSGAKYIAAPASSYRVTGLDPTRSYTVQIVAVNAQGAGQPSMPSVDFVPLEGVVKVGTKTNVAITADGQPGTFVAGYGSPVAVSGDGRYAFFQAMAKSNLAPPEIYNPQDERLFMLRKDLETGSIDLVSRDADGTTPVTPHNRVPAKVSHDGNVVAYQVATNASTYRILVHNIATRTTWVAANSSVEEFSMSSSGDVVAYAQGTGNQAQWTLFRAVRGGATSVVGPPFCNPQAGGFVISGDGRRVAFSPSNLCEQPDPELWRTHGFVYNADNGSVTQVGSDPDLDLLIGQLSSDGSTYVGIIRSGVSNIPLGVVLKRFDAGPVGEADRRVSFTTSWTSGGVFSASSDLRVLGLWSSSEPSSRLYFPASGDLRNLSALSGGSGPAEVLSADGRLLIRKPYLACSDCLVPVYAEYV